MATTTTGLATSFITFSRPGASGGGATVTDRDGKIKWAGHNLLTNSESFDAAAWSAASATVTANAIAAPNGTTTADTITSTGAGGYVLQSYSAIAGKLTISVFAKPGTNSSVTLRVAQSGNGYEATFTLSGSGTAGTPAIVGTGGTKSNMTAAISALANSWYLCTITFDETSLGNLFIMQSASSGTIHLWGAHLYRSDLGGMQLNPPMPAGMQSYYPTTPRNALGWTEDFSNAAWAKENLVAFGSGSVANAIVAPNGLQTADKITESTANSSHLLYQGGTVATGGLYTGSIYLKAGERTTATVQLLESSAPGKRYTVFVDLSAGTIITTRSLNSPAGASSSITSIGNGWYRVSATMTQSGGTTMYLSVGMSNSSSPSWNAFDFPTYTGDGTSGIYLWGAQLSDSASLDTYVPQYGAAVTSAAYYAPRLDFDGATLAAKGLLVEEARTNVIRGTQAIAGAYWTPSDVTMTAATAVAPDGSTTAARLSPTTTGANRFVYQTKSVTNGIYVSSVYAKAAGFNWFYIVNAPGSAVGAWFNLSTGALGTVAANHTATITAVGNGWYRCTLVGTVAATTVFSQFGVSDADNSSTATASGTNGVHVWGAQLELGSFATSFIPNADASAGATRAADVASVSTSAFPYSSSASSLVLSYTSFCDGGEAILELSASASANGLLFATASGTNNVQTYVDASSVNLGATVLNAITKLGIAYDGASNGTVRNGGAVSSVGTTVSAAANKLCFGSSFGGLYQMSGHIRQVTYLPRRISNAELQSRTA